MYPSRCLPEVDS
ncbi:hypothetical protein P8C59_005792 [Phyllachora maydis]|uniref:Uncharacterized protein n=1 Tax=Phyllachora maydis TaxID=1825666 RepID=A0AAD9I568_9PEZI|nr:hypothetical protein P8C59_005792 [Phyllachora maydis]